VSPTATKPTATKVSPSITKQQVTGYFADLAHVLSGTVATDQRGESMPLELAVDTIIGCARETHAAGNKLIFIGNGGSAGIASHVAIDYSKNGRMRATAFNDPSALTCLGNDFGYEHVFAKQIEYHGKRDDLLVAISSSGRSANILNGVAAARAIGVHVLTLSGFAADNPLRRLGDVNLFVNSAEYGMVEISHLTLLHAVLDLAIGRDGSAPA
jgi:D-sedoheptulose 7-phosphate isomerase